MKKILPILLFFLWILGISEVNAGETDYLDLGCGYDFEHNFVHNNPYCSLRVGRLYESGWGIQYEHKSALLDGRPFYWTESDKSTLDGVEVYYRFEF